MQTTGTIKSIIDHGSVVQFFVATERGLVALAGDGNLTREALADSGVKRGDRIRFNTDGVLLEWFCRANDTAE